VRPAGEGDLPALIALHQAEPVRFLRPREDWRRALAAGMLMNRASDLLCIARGGAIVAYAGLQSALRGTRKPIPVCEIAGSRGALAAALPGIAAGYGAPAVDVRTLAEDHALRAEASRRGWTVTGAAFPGTLGIIDPGRFFEATRPLLEERVGSALTVEAAGAGARLSAGPAAAAVGTMGALTALVFGGDTPEARAAPALPPALQQVVDAAFPLPLLWYGYNYV